MVLLLVQAGWAWSVLLGLSDPGMNFDTLAPATRNLAVVLATVCPVAAIGTWFASDWGPVLWALVVIALGLATNAASVGDWVGWAFLAHGTLIAAWAGAVFMTERREDA